MLEYLRSFYESAIDLSPDEMIGALAIGLCVAMAFAGLCLLVHKKSTNPYPLLCGLIFAVSTLSLGFGVVHTRIRHARILKKVDRSSSNLHSRMGHFPNVPGGPEDRPGGRSMLLRGGRHWFVEADANKDGRLTPEEAAEFVREADTTGKGWIGVSELDNSLRSRGGPPAVTENPPPPGKPAPGQGSL